MTINLLDELRRMQSKTNLETYDLYSDSLEALSEALTTYMGLTDTIGAASGLTIVDTPLAALPSYAGQLVKILTGGSIGQVRTIVTHVGNTLLVDFPFTDAAGAVQQIAVGTGYVIVSRLAVGGAVIGDIDFLTGFPFINEAWEPANIDLNIWTPTHPATNNIVVVENTAPNVGYSVVEFNVEDAETARLIGRASVNRWRINPNLVGLNHVIKQFLIEWEIYFNDVANVAEATIFMGLVTAAAATRATNDIVGFGITGGVLTSITDRGGVEVVATGFGEILEDTRNKLRIMVDSVNIYFFVNEVLVATHAVAANLPDQLMYPCWFMPSAGGGVDTFEFYLGALRMGYVDIP